MGQKGNRYSGGEVKPQVTWQYVDEQKWIKLEELVRKKPKLSAECS